MQNPTIPAESLLAGHYAAMLAQLKTNLAELGDADTLLQRVVALADCVDDLHVAVIDTMESPLHGPTLIDKIRAQAPAELHHLLGETGSEAP
ncbi:hypothetical protein ACFXHA_43560 [Nocardia sp. NPDC059240]|uniref:hypothetical protein n=1 Tax=Nocardia sp. NPDC059240 TaxID=3346786 RepID=UPI003673BF06